MSSNMMRTDSGNAAQDKPMWLAAGTAHFTPAAKQQQSSIPSSFGQIFTPTKDTNQATAFMSPWNTTFTPPHAINFLNIDSTPEEPSIKRSSFSEVKPIGSGPSSPDRSAQLAYGPAFTTDSEIFESLYVCFGNIPRLWFDHDILIHALDDSGMPRPRASSLTFNEASNTVDLYCFYDDFRQASGSIGTFQMVLSTACITYVDHETYLSVDNTVNNAASITAFDNQVEFTAVPKSMMQFDVFAIYQEVFAFAQSIGEVRSFAYIEPATFEAPRFRAEYFSLEVSQKAVNISSMYASASVTISAKPYLPPDYQPSMPQFQELSISNDMEYFSRSRGGYGPGRRGRGGHRGSGRGGMKPGWWVPSDDSIVHRTDMDFWRFNQPQTVNLEKIEAGIDVRTTIMLRNIPNRVQFEDLKEWMDGVSFGEYDFSYLRIDFSNNQNVGYAFVNFVRPEFIVNFVNRRVDRPWGLFNSQKKCEVSYATIQGIDCLLAKFRNSVVMEEYPTFRPKLWYNVDSQDMPKGMMVGDEAPFPPPDNEQKRKRSRDNASTVGLFPPRRGRGGSYGHDAHYREGQYDRGTSYAIAEERYHEEQRRARDNERRQIGYRNQGNRNQYARHRGNGRQQQFNNRSPQNGQYGNGSPQHGQYDNRGSQNSQYGNRGHYDSSDDEDGFYHVGRRSNFRR